MVENVPEEHVRMGVAGAREDGGRGCTCGWGSPEHAVRHRGGELERRALVFDGVNGRGATLSGDRQ